MSDILTEAAPDLTAAGEYTHEDSARLQAAIDKAVAEGFTVVRGDDTHLLLDLDGDAALAQFSRVCPLVFEKFRIINVEVWRSQGGNKHVRLTLAEPLNIGARLLLQAALGSDGIKEVLSLVSVHNGTHEPILLFMPQT